jgi:hypothetical protein
MTESPARIPVGLPSGVVEVSAAWGDMADARSVFAVAHGAGGTFAQPFLAGLTAALRDLGVATLRFNFPYSEAGRRLPGPAAHAVSAWRAIDAWLASERPGVEVWAAGKSYGGRMASMAAAEGAISPRGLVYLGYPLHPPGEPAKLRAEHLPSIVVPQLFIEGTNDPFIVPHEQLTAVVAACQDAELVWIEGAGHSFDVKGWKRPADEIGAGLAPIIARRMSPEA